jgi:hypothetical protein
MREQIEWLNYWIEDADMEDKKRVLLIGDSVARDYRKPLNRMLENEGYVVDLLAMSFSIFDKKFIEEIEHFFNTIGCQYQYQYILCNFGCHHGYSVKCKSSVNLQMNYYHKLEKIYEVLKNVCENVISISGSPENVNIDEANNEEIEIRNHILQLFSLEFNYKFVDLYSKLKIKDLKMKDKFHYLDDGNECIARILKEGMDFEVKNPSANSIVNLKALLHALEDADHIYIYGNGKRGNLLDKYLRLLNRNSECFIISEEFYIKQCGGRLLKDIKFQMNNNDIVFVTPESEKIWSQLKDLNLKYYTLSTKIYIYIEEYVNTYSN